MSKFPYQVIAQEIPGQRYEAFVPAFGKGYTLVHGDTLAEAIRQAETVGILIADIFREEGLELPKPDAKE